MMLNSEMNKLLKLLPLDSWFWVSMLLLAQGIGATGVTLVARIPMEAVAMQISVLYIGGLTGLFLFRFRPAGNDNLPWICAAVIYVGFIFLMSSRAYAETALTFDTSYFHPLEYLTLGVFLGRFWYWVIEAKGFWRFAMRVIAAGAACGAADETIQYFVPGRQCDLMDFMLDLSGLACAVLLFAALRPIINLRLRSRRPT
ncbi:MAG: VanZ family protein [Desulfobacteraceae bacterium]|nr:VanZ family protein [Desulfobacteraceae bacterium]